MMHPLESRFKRLIGRTPTKKSSASASTALKNSSSKPTSPSTKSLNELPSTTSNTSASPSAAKSASPPANSALKIARELSDCAILCPSRLKEHRTPAANIPSVDSSECQNTHRPWKQMALSDQTSALSGRPPILQAHDQAPYFLTKRFTARESLGIPIVRCTALSDLV